MSATNPKDRAEQTADFQKAVLGLEGKLNTLWLVSLEMQITKALVLNKGLRIIQAYVAGNSKDSFLNRRTEALLTDSYSHNAQLKQAHKELATARLLTTKAPGSKADAEATLKGLEERIKTLEKRNENLQAEVAKGTVSKDVKVDEQEKPRGPRR